MLAPGLNYMYRGLSSFEGLAARLQRSKPSRQRFEVASSDSESGISRHRKGPAQGSIKLSRGATQGKKSLGAGFVSWFEAGGVGPEL